MVGRWSFPRWTVNGERNFLFMHVSLIEIILCIESMWWLWYVNKVSVKAKKAIRLFPLTLKRALGNERVFSCFSLQSNPHSELNVRSVGHWDTGLLGIMAFTQCCVGSYISSKRLYAHRTIKIMCVHQTRSLLGKRRSALPLSFSFSPSLSIAFTVIHCATRRSGCAFFSKKKVFASHEFVWLPLTNVITHLNRIGIFDNNASTELLRRMKSTDMTQE